MIVTIFNLKGQLVGNFLKSDLTLNKSDGPFGTFNENSSETLRENLKILSIHHPKFKKPSSFFDFGSYLAGLIEGHSHFHNNQLTIILHINNISLAYFLKSFIKFGYIRRTHTTIYYIISKKEGILKILNLINGNIRTHLKWNEINNNISYPFHLLPLDTSTLLINWWLAGFIDANGNFEIINNDAQSKIKLNQRITSNSLDILNIIKIEFGGYIHSDNESFYYQSVNLNVAAK
jgi:hypothetical protein